MKGRTRYEPYSFRWALRPDLTSNFLFSQLTLSFHSWMMSGFFFFSLLWVRQSKKVLKASTPWSLSTVEYGSDKISWRKEWILSLKSAELKSISWHRDVIMCVPSGHLSSLAATHQCVIPYPIISVITPECPPEWTWWQSCHPPS